MTCVPQHLRYHPSCWGSGLSGGVCLMLTAVYLNHLQSDFQIHRILERSDPEARPALLEVSSEMLAAVLQVGANTHRDWFLSHDLSYIVRLS